MSSSINALVIALSTSLVLQQQTEFEATYLTPEGKQKTVGPLGELPLSAVIPPRSLFIEQVTVEYVTTAETTPFSLDEGVTGMKVSIQYRSNTILDLQ